MQRKEVRFRAILAVKVVWLLLAFGILAFTLYVYDGTPATRDVELILLYGMLVLSFPVSLIAALAVGAAGYLAEALGSRFSIPTGYLTLAFEWLILLGLGYLQWFVLLPRLWRAWKNR
jgi:hypothetical protein